ncbi:MAG: tetratricopeptide repeat protein [Chloroflexi bacterium]|nr:tetratricopeptide repeat protein [Chloroflexota bacterium]
MRGRFQARGLWVALAAVVLLLLSPTPIPDAAVEAWRAGSLAGASGDAESLAAALRAIEQVFPWLAELSQSEIPLALASGDGARALNLLEAGAAAQADPSLSACWRTEASLLVGDWDDALQSLPPDAAITCPQALERLASRANEALEQLDLAGAVVVLRAMTIAQPADRDARALLGASLLLTDPDSAAPILEHAASLGSKLAADLRNEAELAPAGDELAVLATAGRIFLQHQQWALAALTFEQITSLDPLNPEAHAYLGVALQRSGHDGRAALEQAVDLAPESALTVSALGLYWQEVGEPGEARNYLQRAVELEPDNAAFAASLAAACAASGDVQAALASFRQAAQIEPSTAIFWRMLADFSVSRQVEVAETGLPAARNAVALQPGSALALDVLGYGHLLQGNQALAERLLIRAVILDPESASARLHYGLLLRDLERKAEAVAQLQAASRLGGDTPTGELARRALSPNGP